jgi:hypothetical protein
MGSLLFYVIANFFTEDFGGGSEWNFQFHHVNEMFMIWPHGSEGLDFLGNLNSIHHSIHITTSLS